MKKSLSNFSWILTIVIIIILIILIFLGVPYQIGLGDELESFLQQIGMQLEYDFLLRLSWILAGCLVLNIGFREKFLKEQ